MTRLPWKKAVLWGDHTSLDSFRWILRGFRAEFERRGVPVEHVGDHWGSRERLEPGTLVIAVNIWSERIGSAVAGVDYVTHNFDQRHSLCQTVEPERHLRLQVYTDDALQWDVDWWDDFRGLLKGARTLFQPWGTNIDASAFAAPRWNADQSDCVFVGAVWDDKGLGNAGTIPALKQQLAHHGLEFVHLTQVPEEEMVARIQSARLAPAFAGPWQVAANYLPCRVFKNVSYGQLALTNVPGFRQLFGDAHVGVDTIEQSVALALELGAEGWRERVAQQQDVVRRYTYRQAVDAIARALEEGR